MCCNEKRAEIIPIEPDTDNADAGISEEDLTSLLFHKKENNMRALLVFNLCFFSSQILQSQEVSDSIEIEGVVIHSGRVTRDDPLSYLQLNEADINRLQYGQDPSSMVSNHSPSALAYSDAGTPIGNYVQFRLRGIDQTRINTTLNGVPLNDMVDQGVFFSNFTDLGNSASEIQIQRGVSSSTNGVASYGGSVNIQSARLFRQKPKTELQLMGGSFDTFRASAEMHSGKLANNTAFYGRFTRTSSDGFKNNSGSDSYSFFFSGGYSGTNDILKFTAFAGKTQNDQSYLPVLLSDIEADPRTNYNHPNDTDDFEQELAMMEYTRSIGSGSVWSSTVYYGGARGVFPFGLDDQTQLMFGLENKHLGVFSDVEKKSDELTIKGGIHAYSFWRDNINYTSPNVSNPDYQDETTKTEFSAYGKVKYTINKWQFTGNLQIRQVNMDFTGDQILSYGGQVPSGSFEYSRSWGFVNPTIGISYNLDLDNQFYVSFGRTGREPTRTDLLQGDGSAVNEFNFASIENEDDVRPEYVNNLELGYRLHTDRWQVDANVFHMSFTDEIAAVGALADFSYVPLRQNVAKSRRSGWELQSRFRASDDTNFGLIMTYLDTDIEEFDAPNTSETNRHHIFSPSWILQPYVSTKLGPVNAELRLRHVSDSFMELSNDPLFDLPGYTIVDLSMRWVVSKSLDITLFANNILDKTYFNDGAPVDLDFDGLIDGPGYRVQAGRNLYLLATWTF